MRLLFYLFLLIGIHQSSTGHAQSAASPPNIVFIMAEDPEEQHPLNTEDHPEFKALRNALQQHIQAAGAVPWQAPNKVKR